MNECRYYVWNVIDVCEIGIFKKFYKIFYCLVDRVVFLFIVYCVVGFFRVFLFVFVINDKIFYKKI